MKFQHFFVIATFACSGLLLAQEETTALDQDASLEGQLNQPPNLSGLGKDVTVVLPPPSTNRQSKPAPDKKFAAIPVSPPNGSIETPNEVQDTSHSAASSDEALPKPEPGLSVRVEPLQSGTGVSGPAEVKLLAPFPAKLLARTPDGWRIEASNTAPHFTRVVDLGVGKTINLDVNPHVLVPDADGSKVFQVAEPSYDPQLGYQQDSTVGAVLSTSIRHLEKDSKKLGHAIEQLQQILLALPQPEPTTKPENKNQSGKIPKR